MTRHPHRNHLSTEYLASIFEKNRAVAEQATSAHEFREHLTKVEGLSKRDAGRLMTTFRELKRVQYIDRIAPLCPKKPTVRELESLLEEHPPIFPLSVRNVRATLKLRHPRLWPPARSSYFRVRVREIDARLLERCKAMIGDEVQTVPLLLKALLLASARGDVNLPELVISAHALSLTEVQQLERETLYDLSKSLE